MDDGLHQLDCVALTVDRPEAGLRRGNVGTIVAVHDEQWVEVEFVDSGGRTYAVATLSVAQLMRLSFDPAAAA